MVRKQYKRDVTDLHWGASCKACDCADPSSGKCNARYPHWPYACGIMNFKGGPRRVCKVNIPEVVTESMYASSLAAVNTRGGLGNAPKSMYSLVNWNQSSDRAVPGVQTVHVSRQRTRHRPGGNGQVGVGVDVKHDSYQRYLNRKKGNLQIKLYDTTPDFYNKGCPCAPASPRN